MLKLLSDIFCEHGRSYLKKHVRPQDLETFMFAVEAVPDQAIHRPSTFVEYERGWQGTLSECAVFYAIALSFIDRRLEQHSAGLVSFGIIRPYYLTLLDVGQIE